MLKNNFGGEMWVMIGVYGLGRRKNGYIESVGGGGSVYVCVNFDKKVTREREGAGGSYVI